MNNDEKKAYYDGALDILNELLVLIMGRGEVTLTRAYVLKQARLIQNERNKL